MRDFPSCFNESGVQVADSSSSSSSSSSLLSSGGRSTQNLVTSVYHCQLQGRVACFITITWTKSLMGQAGVSVCIQNSNNQSLLCKFDVKPWLFSKRKGFRSLDLGVGSSSTVIDIYWDFSSARFAAASSPEPLSGFYLAVAFDQELVLLLGDLEIEVPKKMNIPNPISSSTNAVFVAKREHIFGKKSYTAKAQFCDKGRIHDIQIEYCDRTSTAASLVDDPSLVIRIDSKAVMQVKRLRWKFRGNNTILVDGLPVEVYWDVHSWLFGGSVIGSGSGSGNGNAVFLFQTTNTATATTTSSISADKFMLSGRSLPPGASVISWSGSASRAHGFSLILYAWKNE